MKARSLPSIACLLTAILLSSAPDPARATESCDRLTARMIRATGASLAGREASLAVFRAEDADRMSLDCRAPARMAFGSRDHEPAGAYFVLIGLAAEGLTGAKAGMVEILARTLHRDSRLTGMPQAGRAGNAALRCETSGQGLADALGLGGPAPDITRCMLTRHRRAVLRRRAGLFDGAQSG
ncbi:MULTISPECIES: hypothetical protein [Methylobacterium]|uniref:Uncharacterized protein n=1 Tax=Methylobacterium bullatum TaxID=570505 RepID=A0A679K7E9_9HYPH|nr:MULTISPECIES: hypothetical protein [Methylobacterium]KQO53413.1 hypothetical protein ASF08_17500 [Methylobacterium sp. Leaf85]MBD8903507.1 hypothetical protein [Methylobacterium bullatum]TXN24062.1 hypothetical protein FV220_20600 [Methylobacterium sp. WL19]CAA2144367.1 hypothetical protein MBLL_03490 [Methylobacterium bullatum]GJD41170.1 hypothetical protein OICFNHDK_3649 [Methylobacterium bullatum]